MSLQQPQSILEASKLLFDARRSGVSIDLLTNHWPTLDLRDAEAIAAETIRLSGTPTVGFKLGFTSRAMREQMRIAAPNFGRLTADMDMSPGADCHAAKFIHPRIEPEIAIRLGKPLAGANATLDGIRDAVESVHPALEIVDTRFNDYRFTLIDNTADNSSAAGFVLGSAHCPAVLDQPMSVELSVAGSVAARGSSSNAMGGPLVAFLWLVRQLAERTISLPAGSLVLTGGLTHAPQLLKNEVVTAEFAGMGRVTFRL